MRLAYEIAVVAVVAVGIPVLCGWLLLGAVFAIENGVRYGKSK